MASPAPGPLVRLWGLPMAQLPPPTASGAELAPLLTALLREAVPFIDSAAPRRQQQQQQQQTSTDDNPTTTTTKNKLWKPRGAPKRSPDSAAAVEVSERVLTAAELRDAANQSKSGSSSGSSSSGKAESEFWACRRSVHADRAARGTASWGEFARCFRDEHAASEVAFTPNVLASHEAVVWSTGTSSSGDDQPGEDGGLEIDDGLGGTWRRFTLKAVEMWHKIGRPVLRDRVFPVLQMTAAAASGDEFLVVSVPVPDFGGSEHSKLAREGHVARYVSVERIRRLPRGGDEDGKGEEDRIEWLMATASDAGGVLPMWVQNMAMPGVIWKDVPLFLRWIASEREGRTS